MAKAETRADADAWLDGRRFVALIEHASDITTVLAADSTVQYMSPAAERILGYPASEMIGRSNIELIHPDDRWEVRRAFAASVRSGTASTPVELRFRRGRRPIGGCGRRSRWPRRRAGSRASSSRR